MSAFDFSLRTRIVFGPGTVDRTGALARELGATRVFVVTDLGIVAAGHAERLERSLEAAGVESRCYDRVHENPTAADVDACHEALGDFVPDAYIGLGGGSSIDVAKGCNFVRAGGGRMPDYRGTNSARGTLLPMIAIPTTAGTGSEMQSFALIASDDTHEKMACGDPQAAPRIAILDPILTVTQPRFVTACTGLDTIVHAVETAVTTKRSTLSAMFSTEAFRLAHANLPRVLEEPADLEARAAMLRAAAFGGIAIENSMLGAAHSLANPLTARYNVAHGQAVAMMLPRVVRYNAGAPIVAELYAALAMAGGLAAPRDPTSDAVAALVARLEQLLDIAGIPLTLAPLGVTEDAIAALAADAARQWTARFNPRAVGERELASILEGALHAPTR